MAYINRVEILIPSALSGMYAALNTLSNTGLFTSDALVLETPPDGYTPIWEDLGDLGFQDGYTSTTVTVSAKRYGFELKTLESREAAYQMLRAIAKIAASTYTYQAIQVRDYQIVEYEDLATGFTVRNVRLESLSPASGSLRALPGATSSRFIAGGLTVRFMEVQAREVW